MAKFELKNILSGLLSILQLNQNFQQIENELNDNVLYRKNPAGEPNQMQNVLDMNANRILNLPAPQGDTEPARFADVKNGVNVVGQVLPSFLGNTDKVLSTDGTNLVFKKSDIAVDNFAELTIRAKSSLINGERAFVRGKTNPSDDASGVFVWDATSMAATDEGNVLQADEGGDGRWIRDRDQYSYFDVRHFGGTAFNESIKDALNAANAAGGGIVYLPAGTYPVIDNLTVGANTVIIGESIDSTVIQPSNAVTNLFSSDDYTITKQDNLVFANFTVRPSTFADYDQAIRVYGDNVVISNVRLEGSGSVLGVVELLDGVNAYINNLQVDGFNSGSPGPAHGVLIDNYDRVVGSINCEGMAVGINMSNNPLASVLDVRAKQCTSDGVIVSGTDHTINLVADTCSTRWARISGTNGNYLRVVRGSNVSVPANPIVVDSGSQDNLIVTRENVQENSAGQNTILGAETQLGTRKYEKILTFASLDTTPSVATGNIYQTANAGATVITDLDDGVEGQRVTLFINDANTDFTHSASLNLSGAVDWTTSDVGDMIEFLNVGGNWYEISRSDNS